MSSCSIFKKEIYVIAILWILFLIISNFIVLSNMSLAIINGLFCVSGFYILFKCSKKNIQNIKKTGHENVKKVMDDIGHP